MVLFLSLHSQTCCSPCFRLTLLTLPCPPPHSLLSRNIPPLSLAGLTALISSDAPHSSVAVAPCLHPWSRRFHGFPQSSAACWFRVGNWLSETGEMRGTEGLGKYRVRGDERQRGWETRQGWQRGGQEKSKVKIRGHQVRGGEWQRCKHENTHLYVHEIITQFNIVGLYLIKYDQYLLSCTFQN